jgi:transcriptional regulator with XRE-family HTH domain
MTNLNKLTPLQIRITKLGEKGMSQAKIGKNIGLGQSTVAEIKSGRIKSIKQEHGKRLDALCLLNGVE